MTETFIDRDGVRIFAQSQGTGAPLVFANSLGTNTTLWDQVIAHLPQGLQIIRYDLRGHGRSDVPPAPYSMGQLVSDAEAVLDHFKIRDAMFVGLSIGGMIGQGLAVKRLDQIRALVLSNTAAKIGSADMWADRIDALRMNGIEPMADAIMQRWFGRDFAKVPDLSHWRKMVSTTPLEGYIGCCNAIKGTDFYTPTSGLRLPTLGIAGSFDGATPPDLVRETLDVIPGSEFHLMRRSGHLPCAQHPQDYAQILTDFMRKTGHI